MRTVLFVVAVAGMYPVQARAQSATAMPRVFVEAGVLSSLDRTWPVDPPAVAGLTVAAGIDLTRTFGIRFTYDRPPLADHVYPVETYHDSATTLQRVSAEQHYRSVSWSVLGDRHTRLSHRVRAGFVFGVTNTQHEEQYDSTIEQLSASGAVTKTTSYHTNDTFNWLGATVGGEVAVALTDRVSVVPDLRVIAFPFAEYARTTIVNPGVSVRWRF